MVFKKLRSFAIIVCVLACFGACHSSSSSSSADAGAGVIAHLFGATPASARFRINASASTNGGIDLTASAGFTLQLESTTGVLKVKFSIYDGTAGSPLASKNAPAITLSNSGVPSTYGGTVTGTLPSSGVHSYLVRCVVNDGVDANSHVAPAYTFERIIAIRSGAGIRKIIATEGTQYGPGGWADAQNDQIDAISISGAALALTNHAAFRVLSSSDLTDGATITFTTPPGTYVWSASTGAGFADDDRTILKLTATSGGSNGRAYSTAPSPVVPTIAALRLAVSGKNDAISVQTYSAVGDHGGDVFDYDSSDTTSTDNSCTLIVAGTRRYRRRFSGPIKIEWCGPSTGNLGTALNLAIAALPSGTAPPAGGTIDLRGLTASGYTIGTTVLVDRPVELVPGKVATFTCSVDPCVDLRANFRMHGNDRAAKWQSATNGTIFSITHTFAGTTAEANIELANLYLSGGGASSKALDSSAAVITEGRLLFDNNKIAGFGTALNFGTSVYYNTILKNYFVSNGTSIVVGDSANTQIFENQFVGGSGDQIQVIGFGTKIVNNEFLGSSAYPGTADILFYPSADASQGGFAQVHGNNFFGENEGLNPNRRRIRVSYPPQAGYSSPPTEVTGNMFIGMSQKNITSASVSTPAVTYNIASTHGIPSSTFTGNSGADTITTATELRLNNVLRVFTSGGTLPAPLAAATDYYVYNPTSTTTQLCTTPSPCTPINLTTNGSGTNTYGLAANVHIFNADNATYNGKFTVYATSTTQVVTSCTRTTGAYASDGLMVAGDTTAAIGLENPPVKWLIDDNQFQNFGTVVDDSSLSIPSITVEGSGKSVFGGGNRVVTGGYSYGVQLFSHGGRSFERITAPGGSDLVSISTDANPMPTKIENQLFYSETFSNAAWAVSGTVVKTTGQTDPFGGTAAVRLVADGTAAGQSFHQDYTASGGSTVYAEFWAKAAAESDGSANSSILMGLYDNVSGAFQNGSDRIRLSTSWKKYRLVFTQINSAHSMRFDFRLGGNTAIPCTFYLAFPQVSDAPSDYVTTAGTAISTQSFARLLQPGTLTTKATELLLEQTGDGGGTSRIHLQNRFGIAGPTIENASADLVDLIFQGSTHQSRIRWEPRGSGNAFLNASATEWQIGTSSDPTFVIGETNGTVTGGTGVMNRANAYRWGAAVAAPLLAPDDLQTASGTGATLTIHGQNETGATSNGGPVNIATGTGTNSNADGLGQLLAGSVVRFSWSDGGVGFYNHAVLAQPSRVGQLTDSTGGTPASSVPDVTTSALCDPAKVNNAIASILAKLNAMETNNHGNGLTQ